MKWIIEVIELIGKKGFREQPKILGRWKIENCNKKINHKIDLSNEDHCGPCGQYILSKIPKDISNQRN